jgi:Phosphodiester glycosidase
MPGDGIDYELTRVRLRDGRETTVYLVRSPRASTNLRLICFPEPRRLDVWCAEHDQPEAIVAGFFLRDPYRPLGEVRVGGADMIHEPIQAPWGPRRAAIHIDGDVRLAPRRELPDEPPGDLVTAGPMLVAGGRPLVDGEDREGFSAGASQFDSDITAERHPRCAFGLSRTEQFAVACDGRRSTPASTSLNSRGS